VNGSRKRYLGPVQPIRKFLMSIGGRGCQRTGEQGRSSRSILGYWVQSWGSHCPILYWVSISSPVTTPNADFGGQGVVSTRFLRQCRTDEFQHYRNTSLWFASLPFIFFLPVFCTGPKTSFKNWRTVLLRRQVVTERTATAGRYGRSWYALDFIFRKIYHQLCSTRSSLLSSSRQIQTNQDLC